jgi:hypothetical protein
VTATNVIGRGRRNVAGPGIRSTAGSCAPPAVDIGSAAAGAKALGATRQNARLVTAAQNDPDVWICEDAP